MRNVQNDARLWASCMRVSRAEAEPIWSDQDGSIYKRDVSDKILQIEI